MLKLSRISARWFGAVAIFLTVAVMDIAGVLGPIDRALMDMRFRILERSASGDLVIVQIDSRSLRELDVWPWPRSYHAQIIERLMAAKVREIAIDIDLSARSTEEGDQAFAEVLARAQGRVILPAFRQAASPEAAAGEVFDIWPRPEFSAHAQVGSINVSPAPDGLIRRVLDLHRLGDMRVPAMFALLAGPAAIKDRPFYVDFGIDPNTIPRFSYVDVLRGRIDPDLLAGKSVIVGTTAVELGDVLPVPVYRSMAGPTMQAMAFESLLLGRDIQVFGAALSVPVSAILVVFFAICFGGQGWRRAAIACGCAIIGIEGGAIMVQAATPIALTTAPWIAVDLLSLVFALSGRLEAQARQILRQRETISRRRALMDRMVENSFDGIIIADQDGRIQIMNKAAEAILHCPASAATGRTLPEILPGASDLMTTLLPVWNEDQQVKHWGPAETITQRQGGGEVIIELTVGAVDLASARGLGHDPDERTYHTFTFRDISEHKAAQEAQKQAAMEALAANRAKTEFLANMSHELRTPLNAIIGFSEMITTEVFGPIEPPRYRKYVEDIRDSGAHLLKIINDILDASRIDLGRYRLMEEEVDLEHALRSCIRLVAGWSSFAERAFTTNLETPLPMVCADARLIKQVLINLLSNAFKYSNKGDCVELAAKVDKQGGLEITVKDTGIGIAEENLPNLTRAFFQVDGSFTRAADGVGLGLFLSAAYVKLHGGNLAIDSDLGAGTTVTVRLPAERVIQSSVHVAVATP